MKHGIFTCCWYMMGINGLCLECLSTRLYNVSLTIIIVINPFLSCVGTVAML
jgi:hypothetical protein